MRWFIIFLPQHEMHQAPMSRTNLELSYRPKRAVDGDFRVSKRLVKFTSCSPAEPGARNTRKDKSPSRQSDLGCW